MQSGPDSLISAHALSTGFDQGVCGTLVRDSNREAEIMICCIPNSTSRRIVDSFLIQIDLISKLRSEYTKKT